MPALDSAEQTIVQVPASAALEAARNWQRNLAAVSRTQPELLEYFDQTHTQFDWLFARDGSLTALEKNKWWSGCSVPQKAAEELLRTLQITCPVACFLVPAHSAQISFSLGRLKCEQAIIVILSRVEDLVLCLHCHDFSAEIASHRLWFVAGEHWPAQMEKLFQSNPGLAIPQQFIRTALLSEDVLTPLITAAQRIFTDEVNRRRTVLSELRTIASQRRDRPRITLAAPMRFRLWDDAGECLGDIVRHDSTFDWTVINFDDPAHASPLALASAAAQSDAVLAVNLTRADCGQFIHPEIPLICWLTTRPIPPPQSERDFLLLPNQDSIEFANKSGWSMDRLALLPFPAIAPSAGNHLTIIADTRPIDPVPSFDLSSHQLLWDLIRAELHDNPALINNNVCAYLHSRMQRLNVSEAGLDQRRFNEDLIIPAYQQAIVAHLLSSRIPLRIFGQGWPYAATPISSREKLTQAVATSSALIHLWPADHPHPIDAAGPPVLRLGLRGIPGLIADARQAATGNLIKPPPPEADLFDTAGIVRILRAALALI